MNRTALVIITFLLALTTQGYAQKSLKIGHVNMDSVAQLLPEVDSMRIAIEAKRTIQAKTLKIEEESFNNLYMAYSNNMEGMPAAWVEAKQEELIRKQQMIENLKRVDFPTELQEIQEIYLQKMYDKIMEAVKAIAQEQSYTYVFNSGEGLSGVLYAAPSEDITNIVIKKLNLTVPAPKTGK
jgi:outer membrane protein